MANGVLHVRSTIGMYGAERVLLNLFSVFKKSRNSVSLYLIEGDNSEASDLREQLNSHNISPDFTRSSKRFDFSVVSRIRKIIKQSKIAIVHSHDYKSLVLSVLASLFLPIKHIHHIHGSLGNTRAEKIYALIERIFCAFCSKVITVSQQQKQELSETTYINKTKIIQVNNGTHYVEGLKKEPSSKIFTITVLARFTPEKDHKRAISLFKAFNEQYSNSRLILVGDGPLKDECSQLVRQLNLVDDVNFVGFTRDVVPWLMQSDALLISSITEGLPMSMLEAMAIGIPVISTPVGEIPNVLTTSHGGVLFETEKEFIKLTGKLASDKSYAESMSNSAREYIRSHMSVHSQVNSLFAIYEDISGEEYERCLA